MGQEEALVTTFIEEFEESVVIGGEFSEVTFLVFNILGLSCLGIGQSKLDDLIIEEDEEVPNINLGGVYIKRKCVQLVKVVAYEVKHLLNQAFIQSQVHHLILLP